MKLTHSFYNQKLIEELIGMIQGLADQIVLPCYYSDAESSDMFDILRGYKPIGEDGNQILSLMSNNKWFLIFDLRQQAFVRHDNAKIFWQFEGEHLDTKTFYNFVHPDYLEDFIKVGVSMYNFIHLPEQKQAMTMKPLNLSFEIIVPFWVEKLRCYMWVKQECRPWQVDCNNNLVSHVNFYSVARPFDDKERLPMYAIVWDINSDYMDWTPYFQKFHVLRQPLTFSRTQARILQLYNQQQHIKNNDIAHQLALSEHAIHKHNKAILKKIRRSFPAINFANVKRDVVPFIHQMGFFN